MKITRIEITLNDGTLIFCPLDEARELLAELKALPEPPQLIQFPLYTPNTPWIPQPDSTGGTFPYPNTTGTIITSGVEDGSRTAVKP